MHREGRREERGRERHTQRDTEERKENQVEVGRIGEEEEEERGEGEEKGKGGEGKGRKRERKGKEREHAVCLCTDLWILIDGRKYPESGQNRIGIPRCHKAWDMFLAHSTYSGEIS